MGQNVSFEWQVGEDAYAAQSGAENHHLSLEARRTLSARQYRTLMWSLRMLAVAIVAMTVTTAASFSPSRLARLALWQGVAETLAREEAAWLTQNHDAYRALIAREVPEAWVTEWHSQWQTRIDENDSYTLRLLVAQRVGEFVQTQVLVTQPSSDWSRLPTYRETRFYRTSENRITGEHDAGNDVWLRTLPPPSYWGDPQYLDMDHLRFVFYAPDAAAVSAVAGTLEDAYVAIHKRLSLPLPPAHEKLVIVVTNDVVYTWTVSDNQIEISSPLLMPITDDLSNAGYLARVAMHRLLYQAIHTHSDGTERRFYRWRFEVSALRGWLRNELLPQPAPWRTEAKALFRSQLPAYYPLHLDDLKGRSRSSQTNGSIESTGGEPHGALSPRDTLIWQYMVAESLFGFVTDTYGAHRIPQLLQAFETHETWSDLIPALFSVSEDVFVVQWNLYLNDKYRLDFEQ